MADMQNNLTKLISTKIQNLQAEFTVQTTNLSATITKDVNLQIAEVLQTIHILNQHFTELMDRLPPINTTTPTHKKSKGLGVTN